MTLSALILKIGSPPVQLNVQCRLGYSFTQPTEVMAIIHAARSPDQAIVFEALDVRPQTALDMIEDTATGARTLRGWLNGDVEIAYRATVDNGVRDLLPATVLEHDWSDLPAAALPYLMPSRYCPVDRFLRFTGREFGHLQGGAKVLGILDWIYRHVDYVSGSSDSSTTAAETFIERAGVCRDFTHLGITLCRAASIPARAVAVYALKLNPADFHAVFEVYLGGRWWMVDATNLAPIAGFVRIAEGRDAADIAFMTTKGACNQTSMMVEVTPA